MNKKLKGVKKLNKSISKSMYPFGINATILQDEFAFYFDNNIITFKLIEDNSDEYFSHFVKQRFNFETDYTFILSLLHEVGHYKANDEIYGDIYNFCISEKERIEKEIEKAQKTSDVIKLSYEYFNLPDEIMATQWAVNYMKKHPKKVKKLWKNINNAIQKFYQKNLD
jgi:hypothetical protein